MLTGSRPPGTRAAWGLLAALVLVAADLAAALPAALGLILAAGALLWAWRGSPRVAALLAASALLLGLTARVHLRLERHRFSQRSERRLAGGLEALEARKQSLVERLTSSARRAASIPAAPPALAGDRAALTRLFRELDELRSGSDEGPTVAVHSMTLGTVAWSGRLGDAAVLQGLVGGKPDVFVLEGNVSTTWWAIWPVTSGGRVTGLATAALPVAVRRNIRNQFLHDFDLLAGNDPGIEVHYADARAEPPEPFPPLDPALRARESVLRAPDGDTLAIARVTAPPEAEVRKELQAWYERATSATIAVGLLVWAWQAAALAGPARWLVAMTLVRLLFLALRPPLPGPASPLLSADTYASVLLGPLLRSPLDLWLTLAWWAALAGILLAPVLRFAPPRPSVLRTAAAAAASLLVLVGVFALVADTVTNGSLDIETIPLIPRSAGHVLIQSALLLLLATTTAVLTALWALAGPLPRSPAVRLVLGIALLLALLLVGRMWSGRLASLPLFPAATLLLAGTWLGVTHRRWRAWLARATAGTQAGLVLLAVAALALLLYPGLIHYVERNTRAQIEHKHAPEVLEQPTRRAFVLEETCRRIDALRVMEERPPGPRPPGLEELAFSVWSATDLAAFGFSSAVEIQDPSGAEVSRFALNLPAVAGPSRPLPASPAWEVAAERLAWASAERRVLRASRRLVYHGELHGAIHLYVAEDFWNLSFLRGRDPYSVLFRTASPSAGRDRPVSLVVFDRAGEVTFTSVERPPVLDRSLTSVLRPGGAGRWTTVDLDGHPHRAYLFAGQEAVHLLAYPRLTAERYAADLVEAAVGLTLLALLVLVVVLLVRTLLRRRSLSLPSVVGTVRRRFALRVFVAFLVLAFVPAAVLQVVVRNFVEERLRRTFADQALERAAVAKKGVEDYVFFLRGEPGAAGEVNDAALVWLATVIRTDLEAFDRGRLLATSKRELYASGLLAPRVSGPVFRALVLEGQPAMLETERIGDFSYLVASTTVRLQTAEPGILAIPLASRQREVEGAVQDLDRTVRLATVGFLVLAAALAQSLARRIAEPIRALTGATRRIAQGDLEARVRPTSDDELRRLVESFNQMAQDLDRQRRDLERSNRLAAWAEMARQVAHEVKNPLTPIQLSVEHLRRVWRDGGADFGGTLEACARTILEQVRTLRGMVTEFSAFARPPATVLEPEDPAALVAESVRPYQAALPPGVSLAVESVDGVPPVRADRRLLERAVVNLVENALQAVGEQGRIRVRLRAADEGRRVEIEVQDSGPGVDPDIQARIFEPFFSTKTSGSGLGLALVKKIAEDHGGGVSLTSSPGDTRAVLWIPSAEPTAG